MITKESIIGDVLDKYPATAPLFLGMGMHCLGCPASRGESIEEACMVHGFEPSAVVEAINARIANPFILYLREDGTVSGEDISGTWTLSDSSVCLHLDLGGTAYSGVICRMRDNGNTEVTVFSAVGKNESVWGVKYDQ